MASHEMNENESKHAMNENMPRHTDRTKRSKKKGKAGLKILIVVAILVFSMIINMTKLLPVLMIN